MEQEQVPPTNDMSVEEQMQWIDRHVFSNPNTMSIIEDHPGISGRSITVNLDGLEAIPNIRAWEAAQPRIQRIDPRPLNVGTAGEIPNQVLPELFYNPTPANYTIYTGTEGRRAFDAVLRDTYVDSDTFWSRVSRRDKKKKKEFNFLLSIKTIKNEGKEGA